MLITTTSAHGLLSLRPPSGAITCPASCAAAGIRNRAHCRRFRYVGRLSADLLGPGGRHSPPTSVRQPASLPAQRNAGRLARCLSHPVERSNSTRNAVVATSNTSITASTSTNPTTCAMTCTMVNLPIGLNTKINTTWCGACGASPRAKKRSSTRTARSRSPRGGRRTRFKRRNLTPLPNPCDLLHTHN